MNLKEYKNLVSLTAAKYEFMQIGKSTTEDIEKYLGMGRKICFLRHDIDFSPELALKMAEVEAAMGVCSTYTVLLTGQFYNPFEKRNRAFLKGIIKLGHEVGLHFDPSAAEISSESDLDRSIAREKAALEGLLDSQVNMFSFHNTTEFSMQCRKHSYAGCINAYSEFFYNQVEYTSDSNGYWRFRTWKQLLLEEKKVIQILTHPIWWQDGNELPPYETIVKNSLERFCFEIREYNSFFIGQNSRENRSYLSQISNCSLDTSNPDILLDYALHEPLQKAILSDKKDPKDLLKLAKLFLQI
jgi:hypothetical protein